MSGSGDWGYGTIFKVFLWGYIVGGLTLLPAVIAFAWFWATTPVDSERLGSSQTNDIGGLLDKRAESDGSAKGKDADIQSLGVGLDDSILESLKSRTHEADVFAGYFAVCREYVPGGVNGKPPERTTPAGAVIAMESPSVYQSMYRSIFDRNKTMSPSMDASNARSKKARNVFYVVLRLGHLMLYDNDDQLEVRHVISLAHYKVDVYGGGERIPEGELYIKRNCLRLVQKLAPDLATEAKTFYMFSDNCSEKEDFFHAMLQAQEHHQDQAARDPPPVPLKFETPDLVKLVQQLHASEENLHTRWINALIGRVFLALYKTPEIKNFIATKITKKIARVPKPALISSVQLRKIDMGTLPPFITNPKLKELTVDGDLVVEADVSYKGNFKLEIEAIARIDLGQRFKVREVTLVLASILKRLDGHILLRIKPPPSNRLWMTFETPPRIELSVEPIVSSRQITYGVVLRAIESRIREVVNETLVLPNWDDMPFTDTIAQVIRGGIWEGESKGKEELDVKIDDASGLDSATVELDKLDDKADSIHSHLSVPSSFESADEIGLGVTSSTDWKSTPMKSRSLRSTPSVKVNAHNASTETLEPSSKSLPPTTPLGSPMRSGIADIGSPSPDALTEDLSAPTLWAESSHSTPNLGTESSHTRSRSKEDLTPQQIATAAAAAASAHTTKKQTLNQSLNSATNAARNWLSAKQNTGPGSNAARRKNSTADQTLNIPGMQFKDSETPADASPQQPSMTRSHTGPIGRGQPLPPPGTPLPPPPRPEKRQTWGVPIPSASTFANLAKRKPVPTTPTAPEHNITPQRPGSSTSSSGTSIPQTHVTDPLDESRGLTPRRKSSAASTKEQPPALPKRRQRQASVNMQGRREVDVGMDGGEAEVFVVEAPVVEGSAPPSPAVEGSVLERELGKAGGASLSGSG